MMTTMNDMEFAYLCNLVKALAQKFTDGPIKIAFMGYPDVVATPHAYAQMLGDAARAQLINRPNAERLIRHHSPGDIEILMVPTIDSVMEALRVEYQITQPIECTFFDFQSYTGAEKIHDFNDPIDAGEYNQYHLLWNGGTIEHIFDIAMALRNVTLIAKEGGLLFHSSPFNMANHGFYNLCPVLFDNFYHNNGCTLQLTEVCTLLPPYKSHSIDNPGGRFVMTPNAECIMLTIVEKNEHRDVLVNPVQGRYLDKTRWQ